MAADAHGGLVLVLTATHDTNGLPQRVQRIDGATGKISWEYFAPADGSLGEVAVHPDGAVFVSTEGYYYPDVTYVVGLNGETGAETRWRLPNARLYRFGRESYLSPPVRSGRCFEVCGRSTTRRTRL